MRLTCPICGDRDVREFSYKGAAIALNRPAADASDEVWNAYLHLRDNPADVTRELWYHAAGCTAWLVVSRDTTNHDVLSTSLVSEVVE